MKKYISLFLILFCFISLPGVKAKTLADNKIGNIKIGSNNSISVNTSGTTLQMDISIDFIVGDEDDKKYEFLEGANKNSGNGKQYYFALDYCSSVGKSVVDIYNSNFNQIDLTFKKGKCQNGYTQYTALIKMKPTSYNLSNQAGGLDVIEFDNVLAVKSQYSYNGYLYFNELQILTYDEYNNLLSIKSQETQMENGFTSVNDKIQSSINEVNKGFNNTNGKLDSMNNKQDQTNQKLDSVNKTQQQTNEKLDKVNDALTSEEGPDTSGISNAAGWLPPGPVDSIINLPLSILNTINMNLNKTCKPYKLPFLNDTSIELPCIGQYLSNLKGWGSIINFIDLSFGFFLLYKILIKLYKDVQKVLSFKDQDGDLGGIE